MFRLATVYKCDRTDRAVLLFVAGRGQTCQTCLVSRQAVHDSLAKPVLLARSPLQRVFRKASLTAEKLRSRGHLFFGNWVNFLQGVSVTYSGSWSSGPRKGKAAKESQRGLLSTTRASLMTSAAEARSRKDGRKIGLLVPFITVVLCVFEAGAVERTRALVRRHGALAEEGTETYLTELDSDAESASPTQAKTSKSWDSLPYTRTYSSFAGSTGGEKDQNASLKSVPVEGELGNSSENSDLTRKDQVEVTGAGTVVVARVQAQAPIAPTARAARASSAEADLVQAGSPKVEAAVISAQAGHSLESVEGPPVPGTGKPQAAPAASAPPHTQTGPDTATTAEAPASPPMAPEQPGSPPQAPLQARPVSEDAATPIQMPLPATPRVLASSQPQPGQMQTSDPAQSLPAQAASRPGEASIQLRGDARQLADMPPATVQEVRPVVPLSPDESAGGGPLKPADVGAIPAGDGAIPTGSPAVQPEPVQSEQPASVQAPAQPLLTRNAPLLLAGNATQEAPAPASVQLARPAPPVSVDTRSMPVNNSSPEPDNQHLLNKNGPQASTPKQGLAVTSEAVAASVVAGQASALSGVSISVEPAGSPTPAETASNKSTITTLRTEPAQHLSIAPASLAEQGAQASQVPLASGMMPATGMATMPANGGASVMMPGMATAPVAIAAANPTTTPAPTTAAPTTAAATTAAPTTAAATTAAATTVAATTAGKEEGKDEKDDDESDGGNPEGGHNGSHEVVAVGSGRAEEAALDNSSAEPTGDNAPKAKVMGMDQQLLLTGVAAVVLIVVVPVGVFCCCCRRK
eukprot:s598_g11.t3